MPAKSSSYILIGFVVILMSLVFVVDGEPQSSDTNAVLRNKRTFFVGSRYGRSPSSVGAQYETSKARRLNVVPRNDRFFLGSRYGKRNAENFEEVYEQDAASLAASNQSSNIPTKLSCQYTGFKNFYRCNINEELMTDMMEEKTDNYI